MQVVAIPTDGDILSAPERVLLGFFAVTNTPPLFSDETSEYFLMPDHILYLVDDSEELIKFPADPGAIP